MAPTCVPVAFLCVAPSYVGAVSELEAMRISPPPGAPDPRPPLHELDPAAVERLAARITAFSGDLIFTLTPTRRNTFCVGKACVVTGRAEGSNTNIGLSFAIWRKGGGKALGAQSVEIKARTPATYRAAVAAVAVCPRSGACIPLRRLLRGRERTSEETSFD